MKSGRSLTTLAQKLDRQLVTKRDLVVPSNLLQFRTEQDGKCRMAIEVAPSLGEFGVTELARRQLADKLKIPYAYFMSACAPSSPICWTATSIPGCRAMPTGA